MSTRGQDSPSKSQSEWERTGMNGESTSVVWSTLWSRTAKEQNRTEHIAHIRLRFPYPGWAKWFAKKVDLSLGSERVVEFADGKSGESMAKDDATDVGRAESKTALAEWIDRFIPSLSTDCAGYRWFCTNSAALCMKLQTRCGWIICTSRRSAFILARYKPSIIMA